MIKPTGPPGRIVQALRADRLVPIVCPQLLGELVQVLLRPKFRTYVSPAEVSAYLEIISARAQHCPDPAGAPAVCRDPHDDYLLALAASADADCIISGDADLLSVAAPSVAVLSPRAFVDFNDVASVRRWAVAGSMQTVRPMTRAGDAPLRRCARGRGPPVTSRRTHGEGAIYRTKTGRWRAAVDLGWQDGKRQRKYLSGPTKRTHRAAQLEERLAAGSCGGPNHPAPKGKSWDLVFRTPDGRPIGHKSDHAAWKALLATAGIRDARLHDARHTAASLLLLLKVPARVVMDILGHWSYQLTMNTYSHVAPELSREAAELMAGAPWGDADDDVRSARGRRRP